MFKYHRNDLVRLGETKFEELGELLWFKDNAFEITAVKEDGMVLLVELDESVPESDLLPMPIKKKRAAHIYYDPIIAASVVDLMTRYLFITRIIPTLWKLLRK